MAIYSKKTWSDPLIEAANRAQTEPEKRLKKILKGIVSSKGTGPVGISMRGVDELEEILRISEEIEDFIYELRKAWERARERTKIKWDWYDLDLKDEKQKVRAALFPGLAVADFATFKEKACLRLVSDEEDEMFLDLIRKLQDPEWVAALCECAECGKFILSDTVWAKTGNKFCSGGRCRNRYYGRKNKKNGKEKKRRTIEYALEPQIVECPGSLDECMDVEITATECINPNGKNIRGRWENVCPTCPYKKGGD